MLGSLTDMFELFHLLQEKGGCSKTYGRSTSFDFVDGVGSIQNITKFDFGMS